MYEVDWSLFVHPYTECDQNQGVLIWFQASTYPVVPNITCLGYLKKYFPPLGHILRHCGVITSSYILNNLVWYNVGLDEYVLYLLHGHAKIEIFHTHAYVFYVSVSYNYVKVWFDWC